MLQVTLLLKIGTTRKQPIWIKKKNGNVLTVLYFKQKNKSFIDQQLYNAVYIQVK